MYAYDVNGDGLNDIITSIAAHGYGLPGTSKYREGGEIKFKEHIFMNKEAGENKYGVHSRSSTRLNSWTWMATASRTS